MNFLNFFLYNFLFNTVSHDFTVCDTSKSYQLDIKTITLTPDPPIIGENLDIEISVVPSTELTSINAVLKVSVLDVPFFTQSIDLCRYVTCPLEPKALNNIKISQQIPSLFPPELKLDVNIDGGDTVCLDLSFVANSI